MTVLRQGASFADGLCALQKAATQHQSGHTVQKRAGIISVRLNIKIAAPVVYKSCFIGSLIAYGDGRGFISFANNLLTGLFETIWTG